MAAVVIDAQQKFGIKGDDGRDYTEELQAAALLATKAVKLGDAAEVVIPPGDIRHSATLVFRGTQAGAPVVRGTYGDGFNVRGSRLLWTGPDNGLQVYLEGFNRGRITDVALDGQDKAGRNIHVGASLYEDPAQLRAASGFTLERLKLSRVKPGVVGNGSLAIGTEPTLSGGQELQASEWSVRDCVFMPESEGAAGFTRTGMKAFGFRTLSPGNCKNGEILNCDFDSCDKAIDWGRSSGYLRVEGFRMANVRRAFEANSGHLRVRSGSIECGGGLDDFRLLFGTMQIGAFASIEDIYCDWDLPTNVPPVLLMYGGSLALRRNEFRCGNFRPFTVAHGAIGRTTFGSLVSEQNWYAGCGVDAPYMPVTDGSGFSIAPTPGSYGASNWIHAKSWGDTGGTTDNRIHLRAYDWTTQGTPP